MEQLSPFDASFLYLESERLSNHIGGLYIYDPSTAKGGSLGYREIIRSLSGRIDVAPRLRQRVVRVPFNLDHPYWVDDPDFDLEFHVEQRALADPGDWDALCALTGELYDEPLDLDRPLWKFYVIEGLDSIEGLPKGSLAVVTKWHHAAIDGVSAVALNTALHDEQPSPRRRTKSTWQPEAQPQPAQLLAMAGYNNLTRPWQFMRAVADSLPASARVMSGLQMEDFQLTDQRVPRTRFNDSITGQRVVDGVSLPLEEVKAMRGGVRGLTINDVVLAIGGGALRMYLHAKNELPDDPLVTLSPISVRDDKLGGGPSNQVAGMLASLATDQSDPKKRLEAVYHSTRNSKALTNAVGARFLTDYTEFIPAATTGMAAELFSQLAISNQSQPIFNTVFTNVPGPQKPLYFSGAQMVDQYGLGIIQDGQGLFHSVLSYNGHLTICAVSDASMMPDHEFYAECLMESAAQLRSAIGSKGG